MLEWRKEGFFAEFLLKKGRGSKTRRWLMKKIRRKEDEEQEREWKNEK